MPLSVLLHLQALTAGALTGFTGRGVHGFWFRRWHDVDPATGDRLHQESQEAPFTLSPLIGLPRPRRDGIPIQPGQTAWVRVTLLDEALEQTFLSRWLDGLETAGRLEVPQEREGQGGIAWQVTASTFETGVHPLAGRVSYQELSRGCLMQSNPPRQWKLEFATPTAFHGKASHLPFPLPESLVGSWLRRWQAFAPIALPEEVMQWARSNLAVSAYRLHTIPAREGERLRVGCVGWLSLRALDMPPYLRAALDLLAHYALYCGSGSHTAQGMGQTRVIGDL
jgi:CRISPR-associated endoribonuclease Cas6